MLLLLRRRLAVAARPSPPPSLPPSPSPAASMPMVAAISDEEFAGALRRLGLQPEHRVLLSLHLSTADVVFALLCHRYFGDNVHACISSFVHPAKTRKCFAEAKMAGDALHSHNMTARTILHFNINDTLTKPHEIRVHHAEQRTHRLLEEAQKFQATTILTNLIEEESLYRAVASLTKKHIDLAAKSSLAVALASVNDSQLLLANVQGFSQARYEKTAEERGIPLLLVQHNTLPKGLNEHVMKYAVDKYVSRVPEARGQLLRLYSHMALHARLLQRKVYSALQLRAEIDTPHRFVLLDMSSFMRSTNVFLECLARAIMSWLMGHSRVFLPEQSKLVLEALRTGKKEVYFYGTYIGPFTPRASDPRYGHYNGRPMQLFCSADVLGPTDIEINSKGITKYKGYYRFLVNPDNIAGQRLFVTTFRMFPSEYIPPDVAEELNRVPFRARRTVPIIYSRYPTVQFLEAPTLRPNQSSKYFKRVSYRQHLIHFLHHMWGLEFLLYDPMLDLRDRMNDYPIKPLSPIILEHPAYQRIHLSTPAQAPSSPATAVATKAPVKE